MSNRGYTITLTDSEYDALKARIAQLESLCAAKDKVIYGFDFGTVPQFQERISTLEAALREIAAGLMPEDLAAYRRNRYELCVARLCEIARRAITSETPDEYRDEAVNRILAAKDGPNDPTAPTDPAKFIEWLHGPETVSKQPDQTAAHSPECWKRVYNPNGKCDCGLETKAQPLLEESGPDDPEPRY